MKFLPMWSTRWEESNLPTYRSGNDRGKAGDERAARAVLNGGGDGVRWCSGSRGFSGRGGVGGGSSSKRWIGAGVSGAATRRQRRGSVMAARVQAKSARDRAPLIGFLHWIVDDTNLNTFLVWIELYLAMIWTKSRRGRNRVSYDIRNRFFFFAELRWLRQKC
jgi:hypothetical protein